MTQWHTGSLSLLTIGVLSLFVSCVLAQQGGGPPLGNEVLLRNAVLRLYVLQASAMRSVQDELKLTDDQFTTMAKVRRKLDDAGQDADSQAKALAEAVKMIQGVLSDKQAKRLKQIHLQSLCVRALLTPDVISTLQVTKDQQKKLEAIDAKHSERKRAIVNMNLSREDSRAKGGELLKEIMLEAVAVLTPSQRENFEKMLGPKFDSSRRVPPAPSY